MNYLLKRGISKTFKTQGMRILLGFLALTAGCLVGCNAYDDDYYGGGYYGGYHNMSTERVGSVINYEGNHMSALLNETALDSVPAGADTVTDTVTGEKVLVPLHYAAACMCFVRSALFTDPVGFASQSQDTISLDSNGVRLTRFVPADADTIVQVRQVMQAPSDTSDTLSLLFSTTLTQVTSGDTAVYDWGGAITGSVDGSALTPSSFNLVRTLIAGQFGFPNSGNGGSGYGRYGYHGY